MRRGDELRKLALIRLQELSDSGAQNAVRDIRELIAFLDAKHDALESDFIEACRRHNESEAKCKRLSVELEAAKELERERWQDCARAFKGRMEHGD